MKLKTLEKVYKKASESLNCSIINLEIEIIQAPSEGFLGFFTKNAIITARIKKINIEHALSASKNLKITNNEVETLSSRLKALNEEENQKIPKMVNQVKKEKLFNDFYTSTEKELHSVPIIKSSNNDLAIQISLEVNNLFTLLCYDMDEIKVKIIDNERNSLY